MIGAMSGIKLVYAIMERYSIFDKLEPSLVKKFENDRDALNEELILRNVHLIPYMMKRHKIIDNSHDVDDFISTCFLGLVKASMQWEPERATFRNFAISCMHSALCYEYLTKERYFEHMKPVYLDSDWLEKPEDPDEDGGDLGVIAKWVRIHIDSTVIHLDDVNENIEEIDKQIICGNLMSYALHCDLLTDNQKKAFKTLYACDFNEALAAAVLGKTRQRVHQIKEKVFRVLRAKYNEESDEFKKVKAWKDAHEPGEPLPPNLI